jgi:hypothetical protein
VAHPPAPAVYEIVGNLARLRMQLGGLGGTDDATDVLFAVEAALIDRDEGALARMAAAARNNGRGRPPTVASKVGPVLVQHVTRLRSEGEAEIAISRSLIRSWVSFLGPSPFSASLLTDDKALAACARPDPEKFVRAVHRALGYPGTDKIFAAGRMRRSREHHARTKARALRSKS